MKAKTMPTSKAMEVAKLCNGTMAAARSKLASPDDALEHCATLIDQHTAQLVQEARLEGARAMQVEAVQKLSSMMERDTWTGYAAETLNECENPATLDKEPCKFYFVVSVRRTFEAIRTLDPQQVINESMVK